jgi:pyrimidine-nucleoside phosphorylase
MKRYDDARHLANLMVQTGTLADTRTVALLTTMEEPLGRFAGNWVEMWECIDIMKQDRHPMSRDLIQLTNILSGWMLHLAGHADTPEAGAALSDDILHSGAAFEAFLEIVQAHGGDISIFEGDANPAAFHKPVATRILKAETSGYLAAMDCSEAGWAIQRLGAGRAKPGDPVSAHAGIEMHIKLGERVSPNQPLITLFSEDSALLSEPYEMLRSTLQFTPTPPTLQPLIREIITAS